MFGMCAQVRVMKVVFYVFINTTPKYIPHLFTYIPCVYATDALCVIQELEPSNLCLLAYNADFIFQVNTDYIPHRCWTTLPTQVSHSFDY